MINEIERELLFILFTKLYNLLATLPSAVLSAVLLPIYISTALRPLRNLSKAYTIYKQKGVRVGYPKYPIKQTI